MIDQAITFASIAHAGQRRANGMPYIIHPLAVMGTVWMVEHTMAMLLAAILHDTVEDTAVTDREIERRFGADVAMLVTELTTPESEKKRAERNADELKRLSAISAEAQTIKLADIIDNVRTVRKDKPDFAQRYVMEKIDQYDVLLKADPAMRMRAAEALANAM